MGDYPWAILEARKQGSKEGSKEGSKQANLEESSIGKAQDIREVNSTESRQARQTERHIEIRHTDKGAERALEAQSDRPTEWCTQLL
jgi:hypothetical protein